jgi:hypothetical protein
MVGRFSRPVAQTLPLAEIGEGHRVSETDYRPSSYLNERRSLVR